MALGRITKLLLLLMLVYPAMGQMPVFPGVFNPASSTVAPITLDASCTGSGTTAWVACSSSMTVTAGDTITCNSTGVSGGNNESGTVVDSVNGFYDNVYGLVHPATSTSWATTAVKVNSAGGSITPQIFYSSNPLSRGTISCYAWKGTPTSNVMDGGAVEQTASATVTNPTSGTAAAPSNNNEVVVAYMSRSSSTAPSSGGGSWLPAGTLTLVGSSSVRQASEYQIQTTASAVNGSFTGNATSLATLDSQMAVLQSGQTGGYRAFSGIFVPLGAPGSAPTGTMSAASMGGSTSTLTSININASPYWTLNGTAPTYDTTINPTGTGKIMVQGVTHSFGDSGSSMLAAAASGTSNFSLTFADQVGTTGTPRWMSFFYRMASSGATNSTICDDGSLTGAVTEGQMIYQADYTSGGSYAFHLESVENSSSALSATLSTDTDYWLQLHLAGVNERNHQLLIYTKSGSIWSLSSTLNMDVLCSNGANASCSTPPAAVTTTGTASSGSTALTVASGTGILVGQVVLGTGIPDPSQSGQAWTVVAAVSGTSVTLSQNTTSSLSGTTVTFYTAPNKFVAGTNVSSSVSAGAATISVVTPGTGTIAVGNAVGGAGILQGTVVTAVSLPTVTLSIPASGSMSIGQGVNFWSVPSNSAVGVGKNSGGSCNITSNQWWSSLLYDPYGTWGAFAPN